MDAIMIERMVAGIVTGLRLLLPLKLVATKGPAFIMPTALLHEPLALRPCAEVSRATPDT
jgi:hypothetical protein